MISPSDLVPLCSSICSMSSSQQAVFLHCLKHRPSPVLYSGDSRRIAVCLRLHVRTVQRALQTIKGDPVLSKAVFPIRRTAA